MNFLTLTQTLRVKCRVTGNGPTAVTGQSAEYNRLFLFINEAWMAIQRMHTDWRFMRATASCPTVQGQQTYSPTADFGLTDFGYWALDHRNGDTFRNYANPQVTITIASPAVVSLTGHNLSNGQTVTFGTTGALPTGLTAGVPYFVVNRTANDFQVAATAGGTPINTTGSQSGNQTITSNNTRNFAGFLSEIFLDVSDYDWLRDTYFYGANRMTPTRPIMVARAPDNSLACGPVTAAGYTLVGDYYKVPKEMVAATDVPSLPEQFHWAIVYRAMMAFGVSEAAPEIYDEGAENLRTIIRQIEASELRRVTLPGALA